MTSLPQQKYEPFAAVEVSEELYSQNLQTVDEGRRFGFPNRSRGNLYAAPDSPYSNTAYPAAVDPFKKTRSTDMQLLSLLQCMLAELGQPKHIPKLLASFSGRVRKVEGAVAFVSLINKQTGEHLESSSDVATFAEKNINEDDEFLCEVIRTGSSTRVELTKLPRKEVPESKIQEIRRKYENRWD